MSEKSYKKKYEFQKKMIDRQSRQIESLKSQINELLVDCEKKDNEIKSISYLKDELVKNINEIKKSRKEYDNLIKELRQMKNVLNKTVFKGRWKLIKFLIK